MTKIESILKSRDITLPTKVCIVKAMVSPVVIYGCESWTIKKTAPKNWCFWTAVLEKTLESLLDSKEIKTVNHKGNKSWIFIGRSDAEAEALILWPSDAKSWLIRKDPDAGKDWRNLSPNGRGGWTPLRPLRGLQETRVATREESGVLGFPSRRGLTPRGSLECNPEIPAFPGEEN